MKRIYHPTLNEFRDVPEGDAEKWQKVGWRYTNPGHVTAAEGGVGAVKNVTDAYPFAVGAGVGTAEKAATLTTATDANTKPKQ